MEVPQLFVETLIDISKKLENNPSEYDLLKVAGLLRGILLENLLDDASAAASMEVKFRVVRSAPPEIPPEIKKIADEAWGKLHQMRPEVKRVDIAVSVGGSSLADEPVFPGDRVIELSRSEFLNHEVTIYNDVAYTVENVVRVAANSLGGTHNDGQPNRHKRSEELRSYAAGGTWCGRSQLASYVYQIAICTLRACGQLASELHRRGPHVEEKSEWVWGSQPVSNP